MPVLEKIKVNLTVDDLDGNEMINQDFEHSYDPETEEYYFDEVRYQAVEALEILCCDTAEDFYEVIDELVDYNEVKVRCYNSYGEYFAEGTIKEIE